MGIVILIDTNSMASNNIKDKLINKRKVFTETKQTFNSFPIYAYKNALLITTNERSVYSENIDKRIQKELDITIELLIFATTHTSKSGIPSLSAHSIGNWSTAELGGKDETLCPTAEPFVKTALQYLSEHHKKYKSIETFDVVQEATHHGPETTVPTMFIEIGSSPNEWDIPEAGIMISETLIHLIDNYNQIKEKKYIAAFGIGGTHTCSNFHKIIIHDDKIALAHICPKYMLDNLTEENIKQAMNTTMNPCNLIILDWKGLGQNKNRILELLEKNNWSYKKTKEFKYSN